MTENGDLYSWGYLSLTDLSHADLQRKFVPTLVAPQHMQGARVGRCHNLDPQHALAFAMGTHTRLGSVQAVNPTSGVMGKSQGSDKGKWSSNVNRLEDSLVKLAVEMSRNWPEGGGGGAGGGGSTDGGGQDQGAGVACPNTCWHLAFDNVFRLI